MMSYAFDPTQDDCILEEVGKIGWLVHHVGQTVQISEDGGWNVGKGAFRIIFMVQGNQEWSLESAGVVRHQAGEVVVFPPGQRFRVRNHRAAANEMFWLDVCLAGRKGLPGVPRELSSRVRDQLRAVANRPVAVRTGLRTCFEAILSSYRKGGDFSVLRARAALLNLLLYVVEGDIGHDDSDGDVTAPMVKVIEYLNRNITETVSLEEMARQVGLSVPHFRKRFAEEVGVTPARYLAEVRVTAAKKMLRETNNSIAVIASAVGLSSGQNFATFFRRHTGFTPAEFRRQSR